MNQFTNTHHPDPPPDHPLTPAHTYLAALTLGGRHHQPDVGLLTSVMERVEASTVFDSPLNLTPADTELLRQCLSHSLEVMTSGQQLIGMPDLLEALEPERIRAALESLAKTNP